MTKFSTEADMKDAERGDALELIPNGNYMVEIDRATFLDAKEGKAPVVLLTLKVLDAEDEDQKKYIDATFLDNVSLHENADWRMAQFLDAVYGRQVEGTDFDTDDFIEKKLKVKVYEDEYDGKTRSRVERYYHVSAWRGDGESEAGDKATASDDEDVDL